MLKLHCILSHAYNLYMLTLCLFDYFYEKTYF